MAEGFARALGADVLIAQSAGLAPALAVAPLTNYVMREKNIDLRDYYPKQLKDVVEHLMAMVDGKQRGKW